MVQPGPDPDNYPPIDPTEPVPDDPGELLQERSILRRKQFVSQKINTAACAAGVGQKT